MCSRWSGGYLNQSVQICFIPALISYNKSRYPLFFRPFSAILRTSLFPVRHACGIKRTSYDMISGTGQILYSAASDQDNAVLLQIVAFAWDVARDLERRTLAIFLSAELGFLGVAVLTAVQTPLF